MCERSCPRESNGDPDGVVVSRDTTSLELTNNPTKSRSANSVSHRGINSPSGSNQSMKAPPPPPLPPQTLLDQNHSNNSNSNLKNMANPDNRLGPLVIIMKNSKFDSYEGKIKGAPLIDEDCILKYIKLDSEIQVGPTCGIVALKMIASLLHNVNTSSILETARRRSFTNLGEMFCAKNMFALASDLVGGDACKVELHENVFPSNEDIVWELLAKNVIFLVPYDVDKNHAPGCFGGRKAHWAILTGLARINDERCVLGLQAKSSHAALWRLSALSESNAQLYEVDPSDSCRSGLQKNFVPNLKGHAISFTFDQDTTVKCVYATQIQPGMQC